MGLRSSRCMIQHTNQAMPEVDATRFLQVMAWLAGLGATEGADPQVNFSIPTLVQTWGNSVSFTLDLQDCCHVTFYLRSSHTMCFLGM